MRYFRILLVAVMLGPAGTAFALDTSDFKAKTSRNLVNLCSASPEHEDYQAARGFCLGYLDAVHDYHRVISSGDLVNPVSCPGGPVSRQELSDVFLAWAKANEKMLDTESPIQGVMRASSARWPCRQ